jgi:hypothetical protein
MESCGGNVLMAAVDPNSQSESHMADIQQIAEEDDKWRLEKKLDNIAVLLTWIEICCGIVTAVVLTIFRTVAGIEQQNWKEKMSEIVKRQMIGLPFAVALSHGFSIKKKRMKDNTIVRH